MIQNDTTMFRLRASRALTLAVATLTVAVLSAGCTAPAAPAPKAPHVTASVPTYAAHPTYCAPLAEVIARPQGDFAAGKEPAAAEQARYVALLKQVAKAAAVDGRKDVAALFTTLAASFLSPPPTTEQINQVIALSESALNTEDADCGMTEMPWGE